MSKSVFKEVINASVSETWEVLFSQYGDIHVHNPGMIASHYLNNASEGGLNCARHVKFSEKLYLEETITKVNEHKSFTVVATNHNLPLMNNMSAVYELRPLGQGKTEVTMIPANSTSPRFMGFMVKGMMAKGLKQHLFGMKYYLETGKTVTKENYAKVYKDYQQSA